MKGYLSPSLSSFWQRHCNIWYIIQGWRKNQLLVLLSMNYWWPVFIPSVFWGPTSIDIQPVSSNRQEHKIKRMLVCMHMPWYDHGFYAYLWWEMFLFAIINLILAHQLILVDSNISNGSMKRLVWNQFINGLKCT